MIGASFHLALKIDDLELRYKPDPCSHWLRGGIKTVTLDADNTPWHEVHLSIQSRITLKISVLLTIIFLSTVLSLQEF